MAFTFSAVTFEALIEPVISSEIIKMLCLYEYNVGELSFCFITFGLFN
jgi:hypothetical protein